MAALLARLAALDWLEFIAGSLYWAVRIFWCLALAGALLVTGFFYGIHFAIEYGGPEAGYECFTYQKGPPLPNPEALPQPR